MVAEVEHPPPASFLSFPAVAQPASEKRLSGSAWLFMREGSEKALATGGQLGGSQAGLRLNWHISNEIALTTRIATPIEQTAGAEAAVGAQWRPLKSSSLWITAERRVALGRQGRNAWAAYAAGGLWQSGLPGKLILDGYGQAGIVGAQQRDLFADGALRVSKALNSNASARAGFGVWGAAQPGTARLDLGPHLVVPLPSGKTSVSLAVDARLRMAGDARPGSGLSLTLGSDF